jgi:hypothetical protein
VLGARDVFDWSVISGVYITCPCRTTDTQCARECQAGATRKTASGGLPLTLLGWPVCRQLGNFLSTFHPTFGELPTQSRVPRKKSGEKWVKIGKLFQAYRPASFRCLRRSDCLQLPVESPLKFEWIDGEVSILSVGTNVSSRASLALRGGRGSTLFSRPRSSVLFRAQ